MIAEQLCSVATVLVLQQTDYSPILIQKLGISVMRSLAAPYGSRLTICLLPVQLAGEVGGASAEFVTTFQAIGQTLADIETGEPTSDHTYCCKLVASPLYVKLEVSMAYCQDEVGFNCKSLDDN